MKTWIRAHPLVSFFASTYVLAFGTLFGYIYLQPGKPMQPWSWIWFLYAFSPSICAIGLLWITEGWLGVKRLLAGFTRWKVGAAWYFAAAFLFLGPLGIALVYGWLGNPVAGLSEGVTIPGLLGTCLFTLFSGPVSEEAGWRGFALPRLQAKTNALVSGLILGVIWTCWHIPLFFLSGATQMTIPFPFYLALVVTLSVYFTWLYNNTQGSLIITTLAHFSFNLTGTLITGPLTLMPVNLFYMTASPLLGLLTVMVIVFFGPKRLSKRPKAELPFEPINTRQPLTF